MNCTTCVGTVLVSFLANRFAHTNINQPLASSLPSFHGVVTVKSAIPGRMRLMLPCLANDKRLCEQLLQQLGNFASVTQVQANPTTASLLICYDEKQVEAVVIQGAVIKLLGLDEQIHHNGQSEWVGQVKQQVNDMNMCIANQTAGKLNFSSLTALGIMGIGAYQIIRSPRVLPNGYTMLRWGVNYFFKGLGE